MIKMVVQYVFACLSPDDKSLNKIKWHRNVIKYTLCLSVYS